MLKNYLKIALRSLGRQRAYAAVNGAGLAVGLACCLLIVLYVQDEHSYDHHHEHAERVARLVRTSSALSAGPMGPALAREIPGVEQAARLLKQSGVAVGRGDGQVFEETVYLADPSIFDLFSFSFVEGAPETALARPDALVLTETAARKYFGGAEALGRTLSLQVGEPIPFTVTGVVEDLPRTSHFRFDLLGSFEQVAQQSTRMENWGTNWLYTYLLLGEGTTAARLEAALPAFFARHTGEAWDHFRVQPLLDVRLHSAHLGYDIAPQGSITYVYLFSAVAALILLIACINFVNLATARSAKRAREVGVRKVLGAHRRQLVGQFLGEAQLIVLGSLALAAGLVSLALPAFQALTGKALTLTLADSGGLLLGLGALALVVGLVAGAYPAFVLAAFRPAQTLKGAGTPRAAGGALRKGLVVFQFAISIFLIVGTLVIDRQLDYMQNARLGFDRAQTLVVDFGERLAERYEVVKREVLRHPGVRAVAAAGDLPGQGVSDFYYRPEGWTDDDLPGWDTYFVDTDYTALLGIRLVQGRGFSRAIASDTSGFLINETAHAALVARLGEGWADAVGRQLDFYVPGAEGWEVLRSGPVLGIVEDFHYRSLHAEIGPLVMQVLPGEFDQLLVKVDPEEVAGTMAFLEAQWQAHGTGRPFDAVFLDDAYDALYHAEARVGLLFGTSALLAILIACLGLLGLAAFAAEQRVREIGIRKVMGASVADVVLLLSRDFAALVVVALVVAAPFAYLAAERWLDAFAFRVPVSMGPFLLAGAAALAVALATVSYQSIRAALTDPVKALRYE